MIIPINVKATVKCSDGKCYPVQATSIITYENDRIRWMPEYGIRFTGLRPDDVIHRDMIVEMKDIFFGGYDEQRSESISMVTELHR